MCEAEENKKSEKPAPQDIRPVGIPSSNRIGTPTVWMTYSFAPEWFSDALREAKEGRDHQARRREILLSVCAVESYLLEWVRDDVLNRSFQDLRKYFPPGVAQGIRCKWKKIPKELISDGRIPAAPNLGGNTWERFLRLVEYRNGLVHAQSSRPETKNLPDDASPKPSKAMLDDVDPGWAVRVVVALICELHDAVGTRPPSWLQTP